MMYFALFLMTLCLTSQLSLAEIKEVPVDVDGAMDVMVNDAPVASAVSGTRGPRCYVCNSHKDPACKDDVTMRKEFIQECKPWNGKPSIGCWRIEQWVTYDQNSEMKEHDRVIRKCAYYKQDHPCIFRSGFGGMVSHCLCNSTACNSALSKISNNSLIQIFTIVFAIITVHYWAR